MNDQVIIALLTRCKELYREHTEALPEVLILKGGISRDVVTSLDMKLNDELTRVSHELLDCVVISEEGLSNPLQRKPFEDYTVVIDPLDGSHNYQMGMPWYGTLIAIIKDHRFVDSGFYAPYTDETLTLSGTLLQPPHGESEASWSGPTYFAYPPTLNDVDVFIKTRIHERIDAHTTGLYRWGSAGSGLHYLAQKKLVAFVGYKIRLWDGLAFIPILTAMGCNVGYKILEHNRLLLLASWNTIFYGSVHQLLSDHFDTLDVMNSALELQTYE